MLIKDYSGLDNGRRLIMLVGIYSIVSVNLGNRLQNYAIQETLKSIGIQSKTISRKKFNIKNNIRDFLRSFIKKDRHANYYLFNKNINWDKDYISDDYISENIDEKYDYILIGSDQVWNPTFPFSSEIDYLPFVPKEKKISISASFGIDEVPEKYQEMVTKGLHTISKISVREKSGVDIVEKLTGREAIQLIDPTLMLNSTDWNKIARKPYNVDLNQKYILTYFLGEVSQQRRDYINKIALEKGLKVYNLLDKNQKELFECGPAEFVYLIAHSELVLTDSFHASVFSFIYDKPFLVFDRETSETKMNSRIISLLSLFSLERKYVANDIDNDIFECDYSIGKKILKTEKSKMIEFLKSSLM